MAVTLLASQLQGTDASSLWMASFHIVPVLTYILWVVSLRVHGMSLPPSQTNEAVEESRPSDLKREVWPRPPASKFEVG